MLRPLHLFFLLLTGPAALAQEPDTLSSAVVTARPFGAAPAAALSGPLLETAASAADAVRTFAGLQLKDYGGVGGLKTVNVRSLGSEHVGVYIDGIAVDQAQNMQVDLGRLSTWGWEAAALYEGQKGDPLQTAREYGTASSLHFRTAAPLQSQLRLRASGGAFGTLEGAGLWDRVLSPQLAFRVSAEARRTAGNYRYGFSGYRDGARFDTTLVRENGDMTACRAEAALFGRIAEGEWRVHAGGFLSERGFPGPVVRRAAVFPLSADRQEDRSLFLQGAFQRRFGALSLALRGKYADEYTHYATHPERNPMALPYDNYYRQRSGYLSLAQALALSERWGLSLALDGQYNTLSSDVGQFVWPSRWTAYAALSGRYAWPSGWLSASLQGLSAWDRYDAAAGGFTRENRRRGALSPFVSVGWRPFALGNSRLSHSSASDRSQSGLSDFSPSALSDFSQSALSELLPSALSALEVSAFYKRSYRLPSFNDLYYTLMGNAALSPESAQQLGLDLRWAPAAGSATMGRSTVGAAIGRSAADVVMGQPATDALGQPVADALGQPATDALGQPVADAAAGQLAAGTAAPASHLLPSARASFYYNRVSDKIVAIPTASQFRWTMLNLGTVDIAGAELEAGLRYTSLSSRRPCHSEHRPCHSERSEGICASASLSEHRPCHSERSEGICAPAPLSAGLTLRYTFQRAVDHTDPSGQTYGNQIPYIPLHSGSVAFDASWNGWRLDWISIFTGLRYSRTANIPDYEVAAFSTTDLRLSRTWALSGCSRHSLPDRNTLESPKHASYPSHPALTLRLAVNNLFDQRYAVVQGYPMPGIHALLGVELTF